MRLFLLLLTLVLIAHTYRITVINHDPITDQKTTPTVRSSDIPISGPNRQMQTLGLSDR